MKNKNRNRFTIEVPKKLVSTRLINLGPEYSVFVLKNQSSSLSGSVLKNKYSTLYRFTATFVSVVMFFSPLSLFIDSAYASETQMVEEGVGEEMESVGTKGFNEQSDELYNSDEENEDEISNELSVNEDNNVKQNKENEKIEEGEINNDLNSNEDSINNEDKEDSEDKEDNEDKEVDEESFLEETEENLNENTEESEKESSDEEAELSNEEKDVHEEISNDLLESNESNESNESDENEEEQELISEKEEIHEEIEQSSSDVINEEEAEGEDLTDEEDKIEETNNEDKEIINEEQGSDEEIEESQEENSVENIEEKQESSDEEEGEKEENDEEVELSNEENKNQEQISDEEYQRLRTEIESEIRAELEDEIEKSVMDSQEKFDLPNNFSLEDCTLLSDKELYCLSDKDNYRQFSENHLEIASYPDKNGIYQIVLQEDTGRVRVLTDDDVDNIAPVYNKESALASWQRNIGDRWQVVIYDLEINEEVFVTKSSFNNISPELSSSAVVWQGWVDNGWEIFYANKNEGNWEAKQLTSDSFQNVTPGVFGENVVWSSYRAGEWYIVSYSLKTGQKEILGTGKKNTEPRFALIWEGVSGKGKESFMYLDLSTNRVAELAEKENKEQPKSSPVPNPFESGQTEAVQTPTSRFDYEDDDSNDDINGEGNDETERINETEN